jgi:protein gp37
MSDTNIEWTDSTWNPVAGCSMASAGCTNCYAMTMARRLEAMGTRKYTGLTRKTGNKTIWTGVVREDEGSLELPLRWRKPRQIFVNSMSDLFHEDVSDVFIQKVFSVMKTASWHNFQILTKRPQRMAHFAADASYEKLPNVWLGTSVESADVVDRIDSLRGIPAVIRFISFEPLIGSVGPISLQGIHWAIVGGESGPNARPIKEDWIDEIYGACQDYGTAFFFKQWGTWGADNRRRSKKANGRKYRDRHWDQMPVILHENKPLKR